MTISIRGVDINIFREIKAEAVREGMTIAQAVNHAFKLWLASRKQQKQGVRPRLVDLKPMDFGPGSEKWSSQVDEVVYGWKK